MCASTSLGGCVWARIDGKPARRRRRARKTVFLSTTNLRVLRRGAGARLCAPPGRASRGPPKDKSAVPILGSKPQTSKSRGLRYLSSCLLDLREQCSVKWLGRCLHRVFQVPNVASPYQDHPDLRPVQHELNSNLAKGRSVAVLLKPREQALRPGDGGVRASGRAPALVRQLAARQGFASDDADAQARGA